MEIIAFEGLDKSGKFSGSEALKDYLISKGKKVAKGEFHNYDSPTGKLIMDWLTGKYDVSQKTIELIMAADKQAQQQWIEQLEREEYDYLILDRYVHSQYAYGQASGSDPKWLNELLTNIYQPDTVILLDIDAETSMARKGKHNDGENDRYESDKELLTKVRNYYRYVYNACEMKLGPYNEDSLLKEVHNLPMWHMVDASQSVEDMVKDILEIYKEV